LAGVLPAFSLSVHLAFSKLVFTSMGQFRLVVVYPRRIANRAYKTECKDCDATLDFPCTLCNFPIAHADMRTRSTVSMRMLEELNIRRFVTIYICFSRYRFEAYLKKSTSVSDHDWVTRPSFFQILDLHIAI